MSALPEGPDSATAVEVAALLGDSVVSVKHLIDPHGGKIRSATFGVLAGAGACLLTAAIAFGVSVHDASTDAAARAEWIAAKKPVRAFRPAEAADLSGLAFGGLLAGIAGVAYGLLRVRRERRDPTYRIGTAPGVELPLEQAPSAAFPLVAPRGDSFVFHLGEGMVGELVDETGSTPLASLAPIGRARASDTVPGALEIPIPPRGRIRARAGRATFVVTAVPAPRPIPAAPFAMAGAAYLAGSLVFHLAAWGILQSVPTEDTGANIDLASLESESMSITGVDHDETPPPPPKPSDDQDSPSGGDQTDTKRMALSEGTIGKPTATEQATLSVQDRHQDQTLAKARAIEDARNAGILGSSSALMENIGSTISDADLSSGLQETNVWGGVFGAASEGRGNFGGGFHGDGLGGGCLDGNCGIIGTGTRYDTIGKGRGAGDFYPGHGHGPGDGTHHGLVPTLHTQVKMIGEYDKSIIKRYIHMHYNEISYCYEKELLVKNDLAGEIQADWLITPGGTVQGSVATGFDANVASCVASVVGRIEFPKPNGPVQVHYPFIFRPTGK
ncbi:MAG TPA: AgmX/PglI C-terminal domain-containing protein [Kofleriaceae bacterium]|jgi:hypothetical protein